MPTFKMFCFSFALGVKEGERSSIRLKGRKD